MIYFYRMLNVIRRAVATTIDLTLVVACLAGVFAITIVLTKHFTNGPAFDEIHLPGKGSISWYSYMAMTFAPYFLAVVPIIWICYEAIVSRLCDGYTAGKFLLRIRTTSAKGALTLWQCIFRTTLKVFSLMLLLSIANPWILLLALVATLAPMMLTEKKLALFDLAAATTVAARAA